MTITSHSSALHRIFHLENILRPRLRYDTRLLRHHGHRQRRPHPSNQRTCAVRSDLPRSAEDACASVRHLQMGRSAIDEEVFVVTL